MTVVPPVSSVIVSVIKSPSDVYAIVLPSSVIVPSVLAVSPNRFSTSCLDSCAYIRLSKFLINLASVVFYLSLSIAYCKALISSFNASLRLNC